VNGVIFVKSNAGIMYTSVPPGRASRRVAEQMGRGAGDGFVEGGRSVVRRQQGEEEGILGSGGVDVKLEVEAEGLEADVDSSES